MALTAYLDESGANPRDPALVIGGIISEDSLWLEFSEKWQTALDDSGISHFHMADYEARQDQFKDWPRDETARQRFGHLLSLVTDYSLGLVSIAFPRSLMDKAFLPQPKKEERLYLMTAASAMLKLSYFPTERLPGSGVAVVFEAGAKGRHLVQAAWDSLSPRTREGIPLLSLTFGRKREFQPLQAADIFVYEEFRQYPKDWGNDTRETRYPLKVLKGQLPYAGGVVTQEYLDSIWATFS